MDVSSGSDQQFFYQAPNYFTNLQSMRESDELCDVTLNVNDHNFKAHRIVLAASIPYFRGMFLSGMRESESNIIKLQEIDPSALKLFIDFAYSGGITITESNVDSLLMGTAFFSLDGLRDACIRFLEMIIDVENVFRFKELAEMLNLTELQVHINEFFQKSFNKICNMEEFLHFSFDTIKSLLSKDQLNVSSEEEVMDALIRWIHADDINRSKYIDELLELVRLHLVSLEYLTKFVANIPIIRNSIPCRDLLDEARDYHLLLLDNPSNRFKNVQPRYYNNKNENVFILNKKVAFIYNIFKDKWLEIESPPTFKDTFGLTEYKNKVYVIGGSGIMSWELYNTTDIYDPVSESWTTIETDFGSRRGAGVTTLHDYMYACGGMIEVNIDNIVEEYCPETGTCQRVRAMRSKRMDAHVISFQGCVYAIGGLSDNGWTSTVEQYDRRTDTWTFIAPMNEVRSDCRVGIINEKLYVFESAKTNCTGEVYDPRSNKWEYIAPMKEQMTGLFVHTDKIWKYGFSHRVEIYDPQKNVWSTRKLNRLYPFTSIFHSCIIRTEL